MNKIEYREATKMWRICNVDNTFSCNKVKDLKIGPRVSDWVRLL